MSQLGVISKGFQRELKTVDRYKPDKGQVLVKNVAVASNPKDWKYPTWIKSWVVVEGNDVAGYVEEVGDGVTDFKVGDKVAGFSEMVSHTKFGAYQQYTIVPESTLFPLPPGTTFEEAATYPLAFGTAAIALFQKLKIPTPLNPVSAEEKFPIIVYGASSSVGAYAVQLAKQAGLEVIAVAGKASDYVKTDLGADEVIDYRNKSQDELVAAFKSALNGRGAQVTRIFDAISEEQDLKTLVKFLSSQSSPSKIAVILPTKVDLPADGHIEIVPAYVKSVHEDEVEFGELKLPGEKEFGKKWYRWLGQEGKAKIKPNRVRIVPGGLAGVHEGLNQLHDGKVSGEKLVYRIADTPGLE